jgi:hypothetical protein
MESSSILQKASSSESAATVVLGGQFKRPV